MTCELLIAMLRTSFIMPLLCSCPSSDTKQSKISLQHHNNLCLSDTVYDGPRSIIAIFVVKCWQLTIFIMSRPRCHYHNITWSAHIMSKIFSLSLSILSFDVASLFATLSVGHSMIKTPDTGSRQRCRGVTKTITAWNICSQTVIMGHSIVKRRRIKENCLLCVHHPTITWWHPRYSMNHV